nr:MAG TPA: hypothetical protein [Caudoviricetes sp.]
MNKTEKKHYSLPPVKEAESNVVFRRNNEARIARLIASGCCRCYSITN